MSQSGGQGSVSQYEGCSDCAAVSSYKVFEYYHCDIMPCPMPNPPVGDTRQSAIDEVTNQLRAAGKDPNNYNIDIAEGGGSCPAPGCDAGPFPMTVGVAYACEKSNPSVTGACNNSLQNGCASGSPNDDAVADDAGFWRWRCDGSNGGANSGTCQLAKPSASVPGSCASFTGQYTSQPATSTANGCTNGTFADTSDDSGNFRWDCIGSNSAGDAHCTAAVAPVGQCNNSTQNGCTQGTANDDAVADTNEHFKWRCDAAGGNSDTCEKVKDVPPGCDPVTTSIKNLDVVFLADNTGSMGPYIQSVQERASAILGKLTGGDSRFNGVDLRTGVAAYWGDPSEGTAGKGPTGYSQIFKSLSNDSNATQASINNDWRPYGGGDLPEANFYALNQLVSAGWRSDTARVIVWMGDAPGHERTVSAATAGTNLKNARIMTIALYADSEYGSMNENGQADYIANVTGGISTTLATGADAVANQIVNAIYTVSDNYCNSGNPGSPSSEPPPPPVQTCVPNGTTTVSSCEDGLRDYTYDSCGNVVSMRRNRSCDDGCFAAKTNILMSDGSHKNIEDIKVGDTVMSFDKKHKDSKLAPKRVSHIFLMGDKQTYFVHDTKVTAHHKFLTGSGKMKSISEMDANDTIVLKDGQEIGLGEVKKGPVEPVYNFNVEDNHSYIADDMRVGNMTPLSPLPDGVYTQEELNYRNVIYNKP